MVGPTLIGHENGAFRKLSLNKWNLKMEALHCSVWIEYILKMDLLKVMRSQSSDLSAQVLLKHKIQDDW